MKLNEMLEIVGNNPDNAKDMFISDKISEIGLKSEFLKSVEDLANKIRNIKYRVQNDNTEIKERLYKMVKSKLEFLNMVADETLINKPKIIMKAIEIGGENDLDKIVH